MLVLTLNDFGILSKLRFGEKEVNSEKLVFWADFLKTKMVVGSMHLKQK